MRQAQLAKLAPSDGRRTERRVVNLAARLREPGAAVADAGIQNLSIEGFMAETDMPLEPGAELWLKLAGLEPQACSVVWAEDGRAGFKFATPLHPATLEMLVAAGRKPIKRHFGPLAEGQDRN